MTAGQRIAQRRRELGLSQEALGDRLGVSRQAIYKWESDAALPAIDKLVELSREFGVSIDWLLGREDESREPQELTPEQLRMVEEIVGRYLAARPPEPAPPPKAKPARLRTWPWVLGGAAVILALLVFGRLFYRMDQLRQDYTSLQRSIASISGNVDQQINGIASRVEQMLQDQNTLTAEQSAEISSIDCRTGTVTVSTRAMPKTYVEGMTAEFILTSGGEAVMVPAREEADHAFTADVTWPLDDGVIRVSVALIVGDQRETQVIGGVQNLYRESLPSVFINDSKESWNRRGELGGTATDLVTVSVFDKEGISSVASVQLGLFRNGELLTWYELEQVREKDDQYTYLGGSDKSYMFSSPEKIPLEEDVPYRLAALVTDEYGREWMVSGPSHIVHRYRESITQDHDYSLDPADWGL